MVELSMTPTLYPTCWLRDGMEYGTGRAVQYRAHLSPTDEVLVANFGAPFRERWRALRIKDGVSGHWMENCASAEEALTLAK
jgi:hypothetical protein